MANIDSKNKPLDRKLKIEQQNQLKKPGVNSGAPDGKQFLHHKWYPLCYIIVLQVVFILKNR